MLENEYSYKFVWRQLDDQRMKKNYDDRNIFRTLWICDMHRKMYGFITRSVETLIEKKKKNSTYFTSRELFWVNISSRIL